MRELVTVKVVKDFRLLKKGQTVEMHPNTLAALEKQGLQHEGNKPKKKGK